MKLTHAFRTLIAACTFTIAAHAAAAPVLLIDNGILTGANGVNVGGTLYNVSFATGSCESVFNGCVQSAFAFSSLANAQLAAQALLDQVFVDSSAGLFDSQPSLTYGCQVGSDCFTDIPYLMLNGNVLVASSYNVGDSDPDLITSLDYSTETVYQDSNVNFGIFRLATPAAAVPEPGSIVLFGLAFAGLACMRRRG